MVDGAVVDGAVAISSEAVAVSSEGAGLLLLLLIGTALRVVANAGNLACTTNRRPTSTLTVFAVASAGG